jgi:hypothetical protein
MASMQSTGGIAGDEAIWRKLRRRDKAVLIGYISRLE